jgi:hypothetical protein
MVYNLTEVGMSTTLYGYFMGLNVAMGDFFGLFLMVATYFMLFAISDRGDTVNANIISFFVVTMLSALLWGLEWLSFGYAVIPLVLLLFTLGYKVYVK